MQRRYHLHIPGLIYSALVILVGLAAINGQNNLLFWIFGALFSGLVISGVVSGVMMLGVSVRRLDPQHGRVGDPLLVQYAITNRNRLLPIFNVHIEEHPAGGDSAWQTFMGPARAWVMHVGPRETVHGEAIFWPERRGDARFDQIRVWTTFPFGIIKKSVTTSQPLHTLIHPRLFQLRPDVLELVETPSPLGMRVTQRAGSGDDYYGLREFRETDSVRNIAWKRSALLDQLVSIERSTPNPPKLRIMLDLTRPTEKLRVGPDEAIGARDLEERAISLAASLIHLADMNGFEIGLAVPGTTIPIFPLRRNFWHLKRLFAALASIDLDKPRVGAIGSGLWKGERTGLLVIHPDRVEPIPGRTDAVHLTARQLNNLSLGPIGWTPPQVSEMDGGSAARGSASPGGRADAA